jgi:hypothetical protein
VAGGTIHSDNQSIRFSASSPWALQRVTNLCKTCFGTDVSAKLYAKNVGYDLTLTGGINNPLRFFLRAMDFQHRFPVAVNYFSAGTRLAFVRGLWGVDGWMSVRKGGNDVDLGLSRESLDPEFDGYLSAMRLLHAAWFGMQGSVRYSKINRRIVFSGYQNYALFENYIGQIADKKVPHRPVTKTVAQRQVIAMEGSYWYESRILKVTNLPCTTPYLRLPWHNRLTPSNKTTPTA